LSWLHEILNKLNDIEVEKLQNFRTKGKEKEVYNYLLKTRKKKLQSSVSIAISIDISSNHYHKINSVLISKLFCHLFGNDKIQLLNWLKSHSLYSILKTELKNICKTNYINGVSTKKKDDIISVIMVKNSTCDSMLF
jgi:hypothetical protein